MENRSFSFDGGLLKDFIEAYADFHRWWTDSDVDGGMAVSLLERMGDTPIPSEDERDLEADLNAGMLIFFPFHEPVTDGVVKCLDGTTLEDDQDDPKIDIGVADSYGYLVEVNGGTLTFYPALYDGSSGPLPTVNVQHRCGVFDDKMDRFLDRLTNVERGDD